MNSALGNARPNRAPLPRWAFGLLCSLWAGVVVVVPAAIWMLYEKLDETRSSLWLSQTRASDLESAKRELTAEKEKLEAALNQSKAESEASREKLRGEESARRRLEGNLSKARANAQVSLSAPFKAVVSSLGSFQWRIDWTISVKNNGSSLAKISVKLYCTSLDGESTKIYSLQGGTFAVAPESVEMSSSHVQISRDAHCIHGGTAVLVAFAELPEREEAPFAVWPP